jgi:hypothetical protein
VEPTDLTVKILQEIREEQRGTREDLKGLGAQLAAMATEHAARFEVIETTLLDLAQQLVVLGRGVKVAIDERRSSAEQWDDHERRLSELERKRG